MAKAIPKTATYYAKDRSAWRKWLEKHHATADGIWLVYYKKDSGRTRVSYADAVEEALCFGWIDSTSNPIDEHSYMQLFTRRKEKSGWSKVNKERIERLVADGLMMPAGAKKIADAQANGSWAKLDEVEAFVVPAALQAAFDEHQDAAKFFGTLSNTNRKMILYYVGDAKRDETRAKRIEEMMAGLKELRLPDRYAPVARKKG